MPTQGTGAPSLVREDSPAPGQLSKCSQLVNPSTPEPMLAKREATAMRSSPGEGSPHSPLRESPGTATKTQYSQKKKKVPQSSGKCKPKAQRGRYHSTCTKAGHSQISEKITGWKRISENGNPYTLPLGMHNGAKTVGSTLSASSSRR